MRENPNKSHHLLYLWQQGKNKPKPSLIVIMATKKKQTHLNHLLYLWQHTKTDNYWIPFIANVINNCHNNSRVIKERQQVKKKKLIVKVPVATRLWKEGSKKKKLLWRCSWPRGTLKFQIAFWALRPTPLTRKFSQGKLHSEFWVSKIGL
jgi:hypothetical protein